MKICKECGKTIYRDKCTYCGHINPQPGITMPDDDGLSPTYESLKEHPSRSRGTIIRSSKLKYSGMFLVLIGIAGLALAAFNAIPSAYIRNPIEGAELVSCVTMPAILLIIGLAIYTFVGE